MCYYLIIQKTGSHHHLRAPWQIATPHPYYKKYGAIDARNVRKGTSTVSLLIHPLI
jgi:hypothetical protein